MRFYLAFIADIVSTNLSDPMIHFFLSVHVIPLSPFLPVINIFILALSFFPHKKDLNIELGLTKYIS